MPVLITLLAPKYPMFEMNENQQAYIQKLKDMANGLRTVQTDEMRLRRTTTQRMLEIQHVRRTVIQTVLAYHANFESDRKKWNILLEDTFWLKEPVTPFRSFRRSEVDRVSSRVTTIAGVMGDGIYSFWVLGDGIYSFLRIVSHDCLLCV